MFYFFDELTSTIDEARNEKYLHGDVILAENQTAGRGQRGKTWSSVAGKNLMLSAIFDTGFLKITEQFLLLQAVALALVDTFSDFGLTARIKWPNDIYIADRKIVGVLIDHSSGEGGMLRRSGVGIGVNVNQTEFDAWVPNPTSMAIELGRPVDRHEVLDTLYRLLILRFNDLSSSGANRIAAAYHEKIYRLDTPAEFAHPDGSRFRATIRGVSPSGELLLEVGGEIKGHLLHEISLVL